MSVVLSWNAIIIIIIIIIIIKTVQAEQKVTDLDIFGTSLLLLSRLKL